MQNVHKCSIVQWNCHMLSLVGFSTFSHSSAFLTPLKDTPPLPNPLVGIATSRDVEPVLVCWLVVGGLTAAWFSWLSATFCFFCGSWMTSWLSTLDNACCWLSETPLYVRTSSMLWCPGHIRCTLSQSFHCICQSVIYSWTDRVSYLWFGISDWCQVESIVLHIFRLWMVVHVSL